MSKPNEPIITWKIGRTRYALPVKRAAWIAWCIATYPLSIIAAYYLLGVHAAIFTAVLHVLLHRGKL